MKKSFIYSIALSTLMVLFTAALYAQPGGGGGIGGGQGQGGSPPATGAPIDGGAIFLLAGVAAYGYRKLRPGKEEENKL